MTVQSQDDPALPFPLRPGWMEKLRPIAEWPHDGLHRLFALAWQQDGEWIAMWGQYDEDAGQFRADSLLHTTRQLAGTPTHFVDDIGPKTGDAS